MSDRAARVKALGDAVKDYAGKEKTRIDNEVKVLEAILKGRTGGAGIQAASTKAVASVAFDDLSAFLDDKPAP